MQTIANGLLNPVVRTADAPMYAVVGTLLQFVSTPEQNGGNLSRASRTRRYATSSHTGGDATPF